MIGFGTVCADLIVDRIREGRGAGAERQIFLAAEACQHVGVIGCEQEMKHRAACRRRDVHPLDPGFNISPLRARSAQSGDRLRATTGNEFAQSKIAESCRAARIFVGQVIGEGAAIPPKRGGFVDACLFDGAQTCQRAGKPSIGPVHLIHYVRLLKRIGHDVWL
ncbi:hypothetical protein HYPGJ_10636 [Hyphomicrobium sp. GJ21]|nr:hypothetical protein HYPGJ_10636 [Hyphomicrobium sp. GJ21]